ncbi:hypothetical protein COCSUDRAFT_32091 [Coccomyxa subellipsoidea C-169]|uniref:Uncharacterized protein n=1 Tax=Coccomyxa subellipsoidea (strain C-169) TaxID=574566 RepID=I0ZAS2_COCSC|nr:hypothetical protein COCSUDRAFT_32091 [Coccomyxa subellipsoidea C-169]EIE27741.1 hypothetical protein COCSUDRAFT_32091 [Coccomyxa subellipsoidea C-169]|eukprot:XP_005652285.1 hypothetical protein COCSUDRAFT_32091 [Coccomyxa subellipsoidea C-169]
MLLSYTSAVRRLIHQPLSQHCQKFRQVLTGTSTHPLVVLMLSPGLKHLFNSSFPNTQP